MAARVGYGWDIHRLSEGREMKLLGVSIDCDVGPEGHSDADAPLHAVCDALLGAAGLGDIGELFPDTDPRFENADSSELTRRVVRIVGDAGYRVVNADVTIVTEVPRLSRHKLEMRESLAAILAVPVARVGLKAKTMEGFGAVGEGRALEAHAVVLLETGEK